MDFLTLRKLIDTTGITVWCAIYNKYGVKILENDFIDRDTACTLFSSNNKIYEDKIISDDTDISAMFPKKIDVSHLMDNRPINEGDKIFMLDGMFTVKSLKPSIREAGDYPLYVWVTLGDDKMYTVHNQWLEEHDCTLFNVEEKEGVFVWEDLMYMQADLMEFNK